MEDKAKNIGKEIVKTVKEVKKTVVDSFKDFFGGKKDKDE